MAKLCQSQNPLDISGIPSIIKRRGERVKRGPVSLYEGWSTHSHNHAISLQNHGAGHDTIPYIKAMDIPFHLIYGSLICVKRLQRYRQNKKGNLQTPGRHQNMITKYLSIGLMVLIFISAGSPECPLSYEV